MVGEGRSILLVDDEDIVRAGAGEMLRELGHVVSEARSGAEALAKLASGERIDVLVTDYRMPEISGAELARRARLMRGDLPVLVITGYTGPDLDIEFPKIAKPFRRADMARALATLFSAPDNLVRPPDARS